MDEKIYLKKCEKYAIFCVAVAKSNKVKIRICSKPEEEEISEKIVLKAKGYET